MPTGAVEVEAGVVGVLGEQPAVRPRLLDGTAHGPGDLVGEVLRREPSRHVRHVDPPAVQSHWRVQPAPHHAVGPGGQEPLTGSDVLNASPAWGGLKVAQPALVVVGVRPEVVEPGALQTFRVGPRQKEPLVHGCRCGWSSGRR